MDKAARPKKNNSAKEYVQNLEKAVHMLTVEKLELSIQVAKLSNQVWENAKRIESLENELKGISRQKMSIDFIK